MNGYDQQLKELLAQCARKRKLEGLGRGAAAPAGYLRPPGRRS